MPRIKSDGNGNLILSKRTAISLGLAIVIITALTASVAYAVTQAQVLQSHVGDVNIHWTRAALDDTYMPRGEADAQFREILRRLERIENKL